MHQRFLFVFFNSSTENYKGLKSITNVPKGKSLFMPTFIFENNYIEFHCQSKDLITPTYSINAVYCCYWSFLLADQLIDA